VATLVLNDAFVSVGGTDLSDWVKQVRIDYGAAALDDTVMGDTTKSSIGGLKEWSGQIDFIQDYAASAPDVTLFSIIGTVVTIIGRPVAGTAVGATNPNYTGSALLTGYAPISGSVGEIATTTLSFTSAGNLSRAVA
jgi:hypothetical protein